jgi:hypothetical protein
MGVYVLVFCILLVIIVSAIHQWKLMLLLAALFVGTAGVLLWYSMHYGVGNNTEVKAEIETVRIFYGIEKRGLLKDLEFQEILRKKYGLVINGTKTEGAELPNDLQGLDGFWPSAELPARAFEKQHPDLVGKTRNIFNTPLVLYSWPQITNALIKEGIVAKRENLYIVKDIKKLLDMKDRTWESLRLGRQKGPILIQFANPDKDSSGLLTAGLIADLLNDGNPADKPEDGSYLPVIQKIYPQTEKLEDAGDTLFNRYIRQGQGPFPLISAFEYQLIEFYQTYPEYQDKIKERVRMLIPEPTVLGAHPFIALTEKGEKLLTALQDAEVQQLAWQKHGFRSALEQIKNDPGILKDIALPDKTRQS